jgi:LytR cell envelope-related transcriptional attenuator
VDHPIRLDRVELAVRPWRTATVLVALVAAIELVLLIVAGGALLATSAADRATTAKKAKPAARTAAAEVSPAPKAKVVPPELARRKVRVVVLNGNGRQGAAAAAASRVSQRGYRIGVVGNAPRHDYAQSIVMYRRGFEGEGRRLARDLGVQVVGPLDGMRPGQLHGAHAVFILGA